MDETTRKYRILYNLLIEISKKDKKNEKLDEILIDQKLCISNPSLIEFKRSFQAMKRLTDVEKKEILINFENAIKSRIEIIKVLERKLTNDQLILSLTELRRYEEEIAKLDDQLKQLSNEYIDEAIDYIDNYAIKFKSLLDVHQLNYDLNQLQNVLVKIRLEKAERTYSLYGNEDKMKQLKNEREQLSNELKQLQAKEQQLIERKRRIEQMDVDLINNFKNLKNNFKITEWVMNTLE